MPRKIHYADDYQPDFGIPWVPLIPREELAKLPLDKLQRYEEARRYADHQAEINPVGGGWCLPSWQAMKANWKKYNIHVVLGGNQSGKTTLGARTTVWAAGTIPEAETYCFHVSEKRSIDDQQRFIYESIPLSLKNLPTKKGVHHSMTYSQKNGFTDGICILPPHQGCRRGGSINFFNYAQYQQNDQIIEGIKAHFIWADEKIPLKLMDTLKYRLFTYHGRLLLTYTVIDGWNDTIEKILAKTKTLTTRYSERLKMKLPTMQESLSMDSCCIYYAWTDDNAFTDPSEFWKLNAKSDKATILARAYGVPTKSVGGAFPNFSEEANVIPHDQLPWIKNPEYPITRYMGLDPAGRKCWFMIWVAIDTEGTWWIYREYPDFDDWALPGNKPGPAQKSDGKGIKEYVELIREVEGREEIFERYIDPRSGAAERQSKEEGARTIISDLDDYDMTFHPAPGVEIEHGICLLKGLMTYDMEKPIDSLNSPKLYVSDRCKNVIYCLKEYTALLGKDEATKEVPDILRYLIESNIEYVEVPKAGFSERPTGVY